MITWDKINELIELSKQPLPNDLEEIQLRLNYGRSEVYYRFLYYLTSYLNPNTCLEIGVQFGVASAMMCHATRNPVIGIDILHNNNPFELQEKFNYHYLIGDSTKIYSKVKPLINKDLTIVYQDSSHHYLPTKKEFELYSKHLNGVWICDDITPSFYNTDVDPLGKGMIQYFEELPGDKKLFDNLHHGSVQGIVLSFR